ncbi:MAG: peptidylprolyl isomerase [Deltaproteobacteria bacterium]|jgi:peptidyl-prolyl cis-trans isomerase B (cyclophilin B)|nr:peptidylprolyl isomerase [Deltaproteobacteria bacterium]
MSNPVVLLETTSGDILVELFADKTPLTVENFLHYADSGFYKNTIFHRVIKGFMVQGGGYTLRMEEKATGAPIRNEAATGGSNVRGSIAMARTGDPHSATAQFFINSVDNPELDFSAETPDSFGYCVFGQVIEGMDTVDKISGLKVKACGEHEALPVDSVVVTAVARFE